MNKPPSDLALLRFQAVSAYLSLEPPRGQRRVLRERLAARRWTLPDGGAEVTFAAETLRAWVAKYRKGGLPALENHPRKKIGVKVLTEKQISVLCDLKRRVPARSVDRIIEIAEALEKVPKGLLKRSTVHRVLAARGLSRRPKGPLSTEDLDRFEAAFPNDLWQSDMMCGPLLPDPARPGKLRHAWLHAYLDDHSRLLLAGRWDFKSNGVVLELVFRTALRRFGMPGRVYYDNGGPYISDHMKQISAVVSRQKKKPIYTTPRRPEGHGKIEAFNRYCRSSFVEEVSGSSVTTLKDLNLAFAGWVRRYNRRHHEEIGETPRSRWRRHQDRIQSISEDLLVEAFQFRATRTTDKTGVLKLFGRKYQVGPALARRKVEVRYDPEHLETIDVWHGDRFQERVKPLDAAPARRPKRATRPIPALPPEPAGDVVNEWVQKLIGEGKPEPIEVDAIGVFLDRRQRADDEVVALLQDRLSADVFDERLIREFLDRYGPLELTQLTDAVDQAIELGGADQHVEVLLRDIISYQETP